MQAVGLAWDVQAVPARVYEEARVMKAQRAARKVTSVTETPLVFELADDAESA
jgi:hypothetical protein